MANEQQEVATAIRDLAANVNLLGNAMQSAAATIAEAIRSLNTGGTGVSQRGTFT